MIPEIRKILCATDLSENARYAFSYAASIASRYKASITILHIMESLSLSSESLVISILGTEKWQALRSENKQKVIDAIRQQIQGVCDELIQSDPSGDVVTENIMVQEGHPVEEIVQIAESGNFDLVVMGARGLGLLADAMLGSTSRRVLRRCTKPVLIVRLREKPR
jgi:nucleotide-binding universal stress UspA family protein